MLLQFLNYAQNLDYERGALGSTIYRQVIFQVKDFLEYQKKSNNYYQLKKLIEFFDELQTNSLIKFICEEGHPHLVARYGQVIFKTPKHGKIHDIPTNENGKTPKTEQNALALRDSLVKMPEREDIMWFDSGGYQKGTNRGYDSVNLYDPKARVIAIYRKQENGEYLFSTTCKVTEIEESHLLESNGNYVTEAVLNNQKALTIINPITTKNKDDLQ